jgi:hypothetical protein
VIRIGRWRDESPDEDHMPGASGGANEQRRLQAIPLQQQQHDRTAKTDNKRDENWKWPGLAALGGPAVSYSPQSPWW